MAQDCCLYLQYILISAINWKTVCTISHTKRAVGYISIHKTFVTFSVQYKIQLDSAGLQLYIVAVKYLKRRFVYI